MHCIQQNISERVPQRLHTYLCSQSGTRPNISVPPGSQSGPNGIIAQPTQYLEKCVSKETIIQQHQPYNHSYAIPFVRINTNRPTTPHNANGMQANGNT
ncbi:hypothetical protein VNO78_07156 [Psophocarpus tetragonolobus]|uniref:Uncharacterized protein n=1 Tax=Psophocarpus tetragonolobus TaxID=3891 RepID=A0AAN9XRQ9_PSOTE